MSDYTERMCARIRSLPVESPPQPWVEVSSIAVGGLLAVGVHQDEVGREFVVVLSGSGRGVFDAVTGEKVARDPSAMDGDWLEESQLRMQGIGPAQGEWLTIAGIWGGGLPASTSDGWMVRTVAPDWPDEIVVLEPPGRSIYSENLADGCVVFDKPITEVRAVGFTWSGQVLVEATSSDLQLWRRPPVE